MAVDVANDAAGRERLFALGVRNVPVIARGGKFIFAQNFKDIAEFVGLQGGDHDALPPAALIGKWVNVLRAVQRYMRQMPAARLEERVIDNRDRSIRSMGHHVFRIGEAFIETVVGGAEYVPMAANAPPEAGKFTSGAEIASYGEEVILRLRQWWGGLADRSCAQNVQTFYGEQPIHTLFERSTWHSAQHARQLVAVLERFGIEPDGRLSAEDLAGLPLPEGLWE